jgi:hypothetical protein
MDLQPSGKGIFPQLRDVFSFLRATSTVTSTLVTKPNADPELGPETMTLVAIHSRILLNKTHADSFNSTIKLTRLHFLLLTEATPAVQGRNVLNPIILYFHDPLQVIKSNSLLMHDVHIGSSTCLSRSLRPIPKQKCTGHCGRVTSAAPLLRATNNFYPPCSKQIQDGQASR